VGRRVVRPAATALAILAVALGACGGHDSVTQAAQTVCDRFASPGRGAAQRLVRSLRPGEVGCLRGGTYRHALTISRSGTAGRPITLQARPGERVTLVGPLAVTRSAKHVVIRGLYLNGRNSGSPSPIINGTDILFVDNDVTNDHTAICFVLGNPRYGVARNVTIQRNRIHECGRLPATNFEHGVYVGLARNTRVVGNWIYENADLGVHLYPDARHTYVAGNVIDGNGEGVIFGGTKRVAPTDNLVQGNVISDSRIRYNVEWHFDGPIGKRNVVRRNCIGGGVRDDGGGAIMLPAIGFRLVDNLVAQPEFRAQGDYRLKPGTPCARVFSGSPNRVPGPPR
jgi:nitrous oxidase accessory protein NosD